MIKLVIVMQISIENWLCAGFCGKCLIGIHVLVSPFQQPSQSCGSCYSCFMLRKLRVRKNWITTIVSCVRRVGDMSVIFICTYLYCDREEKDLNLKSCRRYFNCYLCEIKCFPNLSPWQDGKIKRLLKSNHKFNLHVKNWDSIFPTFCGY